MISTENFEQVHITSAASLREWLLQHHTQTKSVWLVTYKKEVPEYYVSVQEVLDQLLCFGWIDGIRRKLDATRTMQLIAPRRVEHWSQSYKVRYANLEQAGLVHQSGAQAVAASKKAGLWDFMDDVDALIVPEDLQQSLEANSAAELFFTQLSASNKRFVLRYLKLAKTAATRQKRIAQITTLSAQNKKIQGL